MELSNTRAILYWQFFFNYYYYYFSMLVVPYAFILIHVKSHFTHRFFSPLGRDETPSQLHTHEQ